MHGVVPVCERGRRMLPVLPIGRRYWELRGWRSGAAAVQLGMDGLVDTIQIDLMAVGWFTRTFRP